MESSVERGQYIFGGRNILPFFMVHLHLFVVERVKVVVGVALLCKRVICK